ncbi:MAG: hypothetical protein ACRCZZ_04830 [Phocaeicola sp.]
MKAIKITQLIAAIIGLLIGLRAASNEAATTTTLYISVLSVLILIRYQIEKNIKQ